jgi:hypothetical protein
MGRVAKFRASAVVAVPIGNLRCEQCAAAPFIFAPGLPVRAWCSPACAAASGLEPWASCEPGQRARWGLLAPEGVV